MCHINIYIHIYLSDLQLHKTFTFKDILTSKNISTQQILIYNLYRSGA